MAVSVEWLDDLDAVAADAAGALDRVAQPCLFNRLDWFRLTRTHILPQAKLAVVRVREGGACAWLFLVETGRKSAAPMAGWYSLRFEPILAGGPNPDVIAALFRSLAKRFDHVALHPLAELHIPSARAAGLTPFARRSSTNWTLDLARGGFDAYWAARPARLRSTVARRSRSHPLDIILHRQFSDEAWADYERVYAASWKPMEGSPSFLRALAKQEGAAGTLRLGLGYDPAGRAVAAQFWLVENGIATIHKLAHREDARAGSPGSLLSQAMFRDAIETDGVERIDFGLGDEPYKADWTDTPRPIYRLDAYRAASAYGMIGIGREIASRLARRRALD